MLYMNMDTEHIEPEVVFWETDQVSDKEVRNILLEIRAESDIVILDERHDIAELLEFYELTNGTGELPGAGSKKEFKRTAKQVEDNADLVFDTVEEFVYHEKELRDLFQDARLTEGDLTVVAKAMELNEAQQNVVDDLQKLIAEREMLLARVEESPQEDVRERYEKLVHESYIDFAKQNPELVFYTLQTGYMILHTGYMLAKVDAPGKVRGGIERSREVLEQMVSYLDQEAPGEVETDPDNAEVVTMLDMIEARQDDSD